MKQIGLSTGTVFKKINELSAEAINFCKNISAEALEICCVAGTTIKGLRLDDLPANLFIDFSFVSLHAPCSKFIYNDDAATHAVLISLQKACERLPIRHVVFHPDTIKDWNIFSTINPKRLNNLLMMLLIHQNLKM